MKMGSLSSVVLRPPAANTLPTRSHTNAEARHHPSTRHTIQTHSKREHTNNPSKNTNSWLPCRVTSLTARQPTKLTYSVSEGDTLSDRWTALVDAPVSSISISTLADIDHNIALYGLPIPTLHTSDALGSAKLESVIAVDYLSQRHLRRFQLRLQGSWKHGKVWLPGIDRVQEDPISSSDIVDKVERILYGRRRVVVDHKSTKSNIPPSVESNPHGEGHAYWRTVEFLVTMRLNKELPARVWSWDGQTEIGATVVVKELDRRGTTQHVRIQIHLAPRAHIFVRGTVIGGMRHGRFFDEEPGKLHRY